MLRALLLFLLLASPSTDGWAAQAQGPGAGLEVPAPSERDRSAGERRRPQTPRARAADAAPQPVPPMAAAMPSSDAFGGGETARTSAPTRGSRSTRRPGACRSRAPPA